MFQLTAPLEVHGPVTHGENFMVNLDRVATAEKELRGVLLCVQDCVKCPHFTKWNFFFESCIPMLSQVAFNFDSKSIRAVYTRWITLETSSSAHVVSDLCSCREKAVERRRDVNDLCEQRYAVGSVRPSSGVSVSQSKVRNSTLVEDGLVEYVLVNVPNQTHPGPIKLRSFPSERKGRISPGPLELPENLKLPGFASRHKNGLLVILQAFLVLYSLGLHVIHRDINGGMDVLKLFAVWVCQ